MILLKKVEFFYLLFLSSIGLERVFADFLDRKANNNPTNFAFFEKGKSIVFVKNLRFRPRETLWRVLVRKTFICYPL